MLSLQSAWLIAGQGWLIDGRPKGKNHDREKVVVTHMAMPNTIEFKMSMDWRVLRNQQLQQKLRLRQVRRH